MCFWLVFWLVFEILGSCWHVCLCKWLLLFHNRLLLTRLQRKSARAIPKIQHRDVTRLCATDVIVAVVVNRVTSRRVNWLRKLNTRWASEVLCVVVFVLVFGAILLWCNDWFGKRHTFIEFMKPFFLLNFRFAFWSIWTRNLETVTTSLFGNMSNIRFSTKTSHKSNF